MIPLWVAMAGAPVVGSAISGVFSAREAAKNREFQERMSSTAHQREVKDLQAAGLNPALSARLGGASSPGGSQAQIPDIGDSVSRGVQSALAVKMANAQIDLIKAQTSAAAGQGALAQTQAADLSTQAASGRYELIRQQVESGRLDIDQKRALMPMLLERAKAEVGSAKAIELLNQAAVAGAQNVEKFEKQLGQAGPWVQLFFQALKALPVRGTAVISPDSR